MSSGSYSCRSYGLLFIIISLVSNSDSNPYELIYRTDVTTEQTGSITMICRSDATAEDVPLSKVQFWLNWTANSTSLQERTDINILEVDKYSIRFNLTRNLEGFYTCGKCINEDCEMSDQKQLICKCLHY